MKTFVLSEIVAFNYGKIMSICSGQILIFHQPPDCPEIKGPISLLNHHLNIYYSICSCSSFHY